jgi:hypothetical protein
MKKSDLNAKSVNELKDLAKNLNIEVSQTETKAEKLVESLLNNSKFIATLEPEPVGVFKIGNRTIDALSPITTVAQIKAQVGYHLKFYPETKATELTVTTPGGRAFKASELMNPQKFVKMQFASIYTDASGNEKVEAMKEKIDLIVSKAYKQPLNWELVGSSKPADIMKMFADTAKRLHSEGVITEADVKLIAQ